MQRTGTYNPLLSTSSGPSATTSDKIRKYARDDQTQILGTVTVCNCVIPTQIRGDFLSRLGSKAELGRARHVKDDELRLEEDVAVDRESNTCVGLDTTEAGCEKSLVIVYNGCARTVRRGNLQLPVAGA